MSELNCHSSTSYEEITAFINKNKGKKIEFHYELKEYPSWGNDEIKEITLNEEGLQWINNYLGNSTEYRKNTAYVHNIKTLENE